MKKLLLLITLFVAIKTSAQNTVEAGSTLQSSFQLYIKNVTDTVNRRLYLYYTANGNADRIVRYPELLRAISHIPTPTYNSGINNNAGVVQLGTTPLLQNTNINTTSSYQIQIGDITNQNAILKINPVVPFVNLLAKDAGNTFSSGVGALPTALTLFTNDLNSGNSTSIGTGSGGSITLKDEIGSFGALYASDYSASGHLNSLWIPNIGYITATYGKLSGGNTWNDQQNYNGAIVANAGVAVANGFGVTVGSGGTNSFQSSTAIKFISGGGETDYGKNLIAFKNLPGGHEQDIIPTTGTTTADGTFELPNYTGPQTLLTRQDLSGIGTGTVGSVSVVTANGVSGTVANPTTTPAITLTLGAITPTSTNGVSAATMAFNDATSSIQTQLNSKLATTTAASTYQTLANLETTVTNSNTLYTSGSAVTAAIASAGSGYMKLAGGNTVTGGQSYSASGVNFSMNGLVTGAAISVGTGTISTATGSISSGGGLNAVSTNASSPESIISVFNTGVSANPWNLSYDITGLHIYHNTTSYSFNLTDSNNGTAKDNAGNEFWKRGSDASLNTLGIGTSATVAAGKLQTVEISTSTIRGVMFDQVSNDANGSKLYERKARGIPTALTTVVAGDPISHIFSFHDGTNYVDAAKILVTSITPISTGSVPASVAIQTNNGTSLVTGFLEDQNQNITLGHYGIGIAHFSSAGLITSSAIALGSDISGTLPIANGGTGNTTFTTGSIPFMGATALTENNANFFIDNSNTAAPKLGLLTNAPTNTLTLGAGATETIYNVNGTNFERGTFTWASNTFKIGTENGGTGVKRPIQIDGGTILNLGALSDPNAASAGASITRVATATGSILSVSSTFNSSSTMQADVILDPTITQTLTGGYRGLWITAFENTLGSGSKLLIDVGTNTAALANGTHTSKWSVTDAGVVVQAGGLTASGSILPGATTTYDLGSGSFLWNNGYINNLLTNNIRGLNNTQFVVANSGTQIGAFYGGTTGDWLIQNGGTFIDNATDLLQVTGSVTATVYKSTAPKTVVNNSTSGTTTFSMPQQGSSSKEVVIYCAAALGTASYTFPVAFAHTPAIVSTNELASTVVTTLNTTTVIITGSSSTGYIFIKGD